MEITGATPVTAVLIGTATVTYTATLAVGASNRNIAVPLAGVKSGDILSARPTTAIPDGYNIGAAYCVTDGTLVVVISHPALVLNASFSIQLKVIRIMA